MNPKKKFAGLLTLILLCCAFLCAPVAAQGTKPTSIEIEQLKGRIVFLRGMESGDKLSFDAQGKLIGNEAAGPFAYSALKLERVHQSEVQLQLRGKRMVLIAVSSPKIPSTTVFYLVRDEKPVEISIAIDSARPKSLDLAIHKVFSFSLQDDLSDRSSDDVKAIFTSLGLNKTPAELPDAAAMKTMRVIHAPSVLGQNRAVKGVTPPELLYSARPKAPSHSVKGVCVVGLVVNKDGLPTDIHVVRSLDPRLDALAIDAVRQYRFLPARYQGHAVPVLINVAVNFRIY